MFVYLLLGLVVFLTTATITFKTGGFDWAKPLSLAEDFAHEIINLYENKELWLHLQRNSEESLKPFSREILKEKLLKI